ncbi:glutamine-hydrolyzing GMP synthase [Candidatus Woesearchaeota archaeon]|nr:glutamine-hydrolyzing GMP synthase [Candidatus Woesearchaeota archaeon]
MDKIIILDMGGQYCHLLARRVRQLNVYSEIKNSDVNIDELKDAKGIIISGGPNSVYGEDAPKYDEKLFSLNIPILGLCYGHQLMASALGGEVKKGESQEYGSATLKVKIDEGVLAGLSTLETVWMSHGDVVEKLPDGFEIFGSTDDCKTAAVGNEKKQYYGLQFHPEVTHTPNGMKIIENFVLKICECKQEWNMHNFLEKKIEEIKEQVGDKGVFLLVSGGIDSTVCFALLEKALGSKRVYGLHVNNGLMRKNESRSVKKGLTELGFKLHVVKAEDDFLNPLAGVYDPEEKRKIIGEKFIEVQQKVVDKLELDNNKWLLGQGTIYPDTIESKGTKHSDLIKTHHNRVEAVQKLIDEGKVIEPISELYKDEVRKLALELKLPKSLIYRHPFPGPGLGIRCLCVEEPEKIKNEAGINKRINEIAEKYTMNGKLLPIKSVGVQGDSRTYSYAAVVMGKSNWSKLGELSTEITNNIPEVNRVVWLLHFSNFEGRVKQFSVTRPRIELLRDADEIVMEKLDPKSKFQIWQFPVVLIPYGVRGESIILRPVYSKEAMTAEFAKLKPKVLKRIVDSLLKIFGINAVFYDITNKPPATIEWE